MLVTWLKLRSMHDLLHSPLHAFTGQRVVAGVSGGADSVALLLALSEVGVDVHAAHFDHALRPDSAADADWVRALSGRLGVPFHTVRVDAAAVAQKRGWNLEDAARRLRYDFLGRVAKGVGAQAILTAHTRRDQAETVLTGLLRGEGVVQGIPARRGHVHRPWLHVPRPAIEAYLQEREQAWLDDPTNTDTHYNRAWIRQQLMPLLSTRYPAAEEALARHAELARQDEEVLRALAQAITPHTPLPGEPAAVLRRFLAQELRRSGLDFHAGHLEELARALKETRTLHLTLPSDQSVTVTGGSLHLPTSAATNGAPLPFPVPAGWHQRAWQPGDRIDLPTGSRKLSDVFTDRKVPRQQRPHLPLLVNEQGAVQWVGLTPPLWATGAWESAGRPRDALDTAMREALKLAGEAAQAGEVPVGAVVLDGQGEIIGRGRNTSRQHGDMTRHAELAALREAAHTNGAYLTDCTLVVTLEPCPMCLGAALEARMGRIVYGASNPKAGALGGVHDLLKHHWGHCAQVQGGYRAREAEKLLREMFRSLRQ